MDIAAREFRKAEAVAGKVASHVDPAMYALPAASTAIGEARVGALAPPGGTYPGGNPAKDVR